MKPHVPIVLNSNPNWDTVSLEIGAPAQNCTEQQKDEPKSRYSTFFNTDGTQKTAYESYFSNKTRFILSSVCWRHGLGCVIKISGTRRRFYRNFWRTVLRCVSCIIAEYVANAESLLKYRQKKILLCYLCRKRK